MSQIIFKCKDSDNDEVVIEAYELDLYIYMTIQSLQKVTTHDVIIAIHPLVLDFLIASDFNHVDIEHVDGDTKFHIYGKDVIITKDCMLKILVDPIDQPFNDMEVKI